MDIRLPSKKKPKFRLIQEFQMIDLIPYSIGFLMLIGDIYLVIKFLHLPRVGIS